MKKERTNKCTECGKIIIFSETLKDLWPFCSKRCKMIDLGKWLREKYVINEEQDKMKKEDLE